MRIIHMSDLHLTQDGSTIWGEDTREKFIIAIDMIKKMQDIDAILVSGDISNDGSFSSYILQIDYFPALIFLHTGVLVTMIILIY